MVISEILRQLQKFVRLITLFVALFGMSISCVYAWDGAANGKIQNFEVTNGQNYAFRVAIAGVSSMCGSNSMSWAFLNENDSNYKVYVANLMVAKAAGNSVTLFTTNESGYCRIGHIFVY